MQTTLQVRDRGEVVPRFTNLGIYLLLLPIIAETSKIASFGVCANVLA